ncbi:hypothetical protein [Bosea sp. RAC05]|uniref:hypothetical protein n=1 Tax=Bosea sp. RAC05 TaxID=1842539 RepID=UPI00083CC799|nr:hypothetical protein [Bosea sp. RAC05]AOG03005.1 putative membrane protein [Bosea sp. RAC05]
MHIQVRPQYSFAVGYLAIGAVLYSFLASGIFSLSLPWLVAWMVAWPVLLALKTVKAAFVLAGVACGVAGVLSLVKGRRGSAGILLAIAAILVLVV